MTTENEKSIIHIISIDFNYIMYPCIKLYHDLCIDKENASINWNIIKEKRGISDNFLYYDTKSYHEIMKLIQLIMKENNNCKLIPIGSHDKIINKLSNYKDDNYLYDLVNIDFYHDILYTNDQKNLITSFNTYDSHDWVGELFLHDKLERYVWVKAPNSNLYNFDLTKDNNIKFNPIDDIRSLDYLEILKDCSTIWDYIFINFSENQIPYEYKHLYNLIFELFQRKE